MIYLPENIIENILSPRRERRVQKKATHPPRLLDIDESAGYLGMSDKAVRQLIVGGELGYIQKVPGRSPYLIDIKDLDRWIEGNKTRPTKETA